MFRQPNCRTLGSPWSNLTSVQPQLLNASLNAHCLDQECGYRRERWPALQLCDKPCFNYGVLDFGSNPSQSAYLLAAKVKSNHGNFVAPLGLSVQ